MIKSGIKTNNRSVWTNSKKKKNNKKMSILNMKENLKHFLRDFIFYLKGESFLGRKCLKFTHFHEETIETLSFSLNSDFLDFSRFIFHKTFFSHFSFCYKIFNNIFGWNLLLNNYASKLNEKKNIIYLQF